MLNQKKWFVLFAALFLGLAAEIIAPEGFIKTANAETKESVDLLCTEDVWKAVYQDLMYGEMTSEKLTAMALAEVKAQDLSLMTNATDHIVNYHGERFAITDDDYQVLLRIVQAEASSEDVKGRMLVANVVLNRLEIGFGGKTISEVVFAKNQFSPVSDGRFFTVEISELTVEAVERVLNGEDISQGALYFMCRPLASKKGIRWFDNNLKFLFKHGCHEFYTDYVERD